MLQNDVKAEEASQRLLSSKQTTLLSLMDSNHLVKGAGSMKITMHSKYFDM